MKQNMFLYLLAVLAVIFAFTPFILAADWNPLPDTNQIKCYDVPGAEIACPAEGQPLHGQDAQYQGLTPFYLNNNDGTVTDLNTGLMWMRDTVDRDSNGSITSADRFTWQEGINYCEGSNFSEYSDWRLPEIFELQSIVDYSKTTVGISPPFTAEMYSTGYWSETCTAYNPDYCWELFFWLTGNSNGDYRTCGKGCNLHIRCVRGEYTSRGPYSNHGNGTVTDTATGLMWNAGYSR